MSSEDKTHRSTYSKGSMENKQALYLLVISLLCLQSEGFNNEPNEQQPLMTGDEVATRDSLKTGAYFAPTKVAYIGTGHWTLVIDVNTNQLEEAVDLTDTSLRKLHEEMERIMNTGNGTDLIIIESHY